MTLSIIIPVYNEKKTILELIRNVVAVDFPYNYEIIIIDDGSNDGTEKIIRNLETADFANAGIPIKTFFFSQNQGKGASLRYAFQKAQGEIIVVQDADLEYNPQDILKLVQPILENKAKVVYGSRALVETCRSSHYLFYFGNKLISFLFWLFYQSKITDPTTCYKVFKKDIIANHIFHLKGFDFESELTSKFLKSGEQILELPISYHGRSFQEGKKINWRDGFRAIKALIKCRFYD